MFKCNLCGNKNKYEILADKYGIRFNCYETNKYIVKCPVCKLVQLYPIWKDSELKKIYDFYNDKKDFKGQTNPSVRISKYLEKYFLPNSRILEIGCGKGDNVKYFHKKGYNIEGIDLDPGVVVENLIIQTDYKEYLKNDTEGFYDIIYALHVFEHIRSAKDFFKLTLGKLQYKGKLILEIPNMEEPLFNLYNIPEFKTFYYRPDHLNFYTYETIEKMLIANKIKHYKIKRVQNYGIINHLNWVLRKQPTNLKINIPILDNIYKWILINIFKRSDTLLIIIDNI